MKKVFAIILALLVVAGAGALWLFSTFDDQTEAKTPDVLAEFRALKGADDVGPAQGVYTYAVTGTERISRTGLKVDRTLPAQAPALVYGVEGGYEMKTIFSKEHVETNRYATRDGGLHLTFAKTVIQVGPLSVTRDRTWTPTLLRLPTSARPGATTKGDFTAGDLKLAVTTTVLPPEAVSVGGEQIEATVVKFDQVVTGEYTGSRTETFWWGEDGVLLRYSIDSSLRGPTNLDFVAEQTLTSLTPQV